jgi:hypothetical protein
MEEKDSPIKLSEDGAGQLKEKEQLEMHVRKQLLLKRKLKMQKRKLLMQKKAADAAAEKKAAADKVVADKKVADKKAADKAALDKANSLRQDGKTAEAYVPLDQTGRKVPTTTQEATNEAFAEKLKAEELANKARYDYANYEIKNPYADAKNIYADSQDYYKGLTDPFAANVDHYAGLQDTYADDKCLC